MSKLTERRKADRAKMAAMIIAAMESAGAQAAIDETWDHDPRELMIRITAPGGAYISVLLDGGSCQPDCHVVTWNTPRAVFINPAMGDINPHHYGKATRVEYGVERLIARLSNDVERFASGDGYLRHDDPRLVAMAESYAARNWPDPRIADAAPWWQSAS